MSRRPRFRRRARPRAAIALAAAAVALVAALWVGGFVWFAETLPRAVADSESITDGIVVFTGGPERLATALGLLAAGKARKMFVSGVSPGVRESDIQADPGREALFECCVVLGYEALDTAGNAAETAAWATGEGYASLRVVTAAYHMRNVERLADGFEVGDTVPDDLQDPLPMTSSNESGLLISVTYKIR